jgi:protein ImuB
LSPCPSTEFLRISAEDIALLRQLGIETIDQLLSLPREDLASRFGKELLRRLDQFTGVAAEVIVPHRPLAPLEANYSLDEPTADRATLLYILTQLVDALAEQLAARDQGAVLLVCLLGHPGREATLLRIGLVEPSASSRQIMELVALHLETVRLPDEVIRVEVRVMTAGRLGQRQGELFSDRWPTDPHQLAILINRLASRLGYQQVAQPELRRSPVPERAVRWVPVMQCSERERGRSRKGKKKLLRSRARLSFSPAPSLPLWLYPQPRPIEVVCIAPDGPPQFVWFNHCRERIIHHAGPERIETLWWRGPSIRRDYYRVATETGEHLWLFRRLVDAHWFLHGHFA